MDSTNFIHKIVSNPPRNILKRKNCEKIHFLVPQKAKKVQDILYSLKSQCI